MADLLKCELQDDKGNIFYLHTDASVVFCTDGQSVQTKLNSKIDTSKIVNNLTTTNAGFVLDARMGKTLKDEVNQLNTNLSVEIIKTSVGTAWKYKDGRLIQFGRCATDAIAGNGYIAQCTYTFPAAFANTSYNIFASRGAYGNASSMLDLVPCASVFSSTGFALTIQKKSGGMSAGEKYNVDWFAIGAWK